MCCAGNKQTTVTFIQRNSRMRLAPLCYMVSLALVIAPCDHHHDPLHRALDHFPGCPKHMAQPPAGCASVHPFAYLASPNCDCDCERSPLGAPNRSRGPLISTSLLPPTPRLCNRHCIRSVTMSAGHARRQQFPRATTKQRGSCMPPGTISDRSARMT